MKSYMISYMICMYDFNVHWVVEIISDIMYDVYV